MLAPEDLAVLDRLARETEREDLPALVGRLAETDARARLRLHADVGGPPANGGAPAPEHLITPDAAATIASVPTTRIYAWAAPQKKLPPGRRPWARWPSKRCLRIDEDGFRRWMAARTD